ncbi:hypothetical protein CWI38_0507p0040 [Hamiltosporidium tvaerminnensis]|uniref:Uncharacterized protein n=2 Tax=Hamiltosporidium tvaerminnensis TaxID=1176355 RepID=A0A4Q9LZF2_9MICR|nr:hypothetical protein CWI38_0507p0040 [Hamiltosporidium tvaerminnensis]
MNGSKLLIFKFNIINCSLIVALLGNLKKCFDTPFEYFFEICFLTFSIFLMTKGAKYSAVSLTGLLILILSGYFFGFFNKLQNTFKENEKSVNLILPEVCQKMVNLIERNPKVIWKIIFVVCLILAFLLNFVFKMNHFVIFGILTIVAYREIFHEKALIKFFIEKNYFRRILFVLFVIFAWYLSALVPILLLSIICCYFGALLFLSTVELLFNRNWGFKNAILNFNIDQVSVIGWGLSIIWFILFILALSFQVSTNISKLRK